MIIRRYIHNLFKLAGLTITLLYRLRFQKSFIKNTIAIDIVNSKKTNDNSLDEKDFKKITGYYGLAVPAILGESFSILRGYKMSKKERSSLTYLGGITGLFDDFFDKHSTPDMHIEELIENRPGLVVIKSNEKLFTGFYRKALNDSANPDLVKENLYKVFEAQVLSKKQTLPEIDKNEIKSITLQKGGISLIFYRSTIAPDISVEEMELLFKLGGLMQLENDIFDIYKDYMDGIKTLVTIETKIENLRNYYKSLMDDVLWAVYNTMFPAKNKEKFIDIILMIICRGFVCLDMLESKEKLSNGIFTIKDYQRKDLICDMEKPINILKTIDYFAKYNIKPA